jgi:hypothetical protein
MIGNKINYFFLFLFTPFGIFIILRILIPGIWCFDYLISNLKNEDSLLILGHLLYLIILLIGFLKIFTFVFDKQRKIELSNSFINDNFQPLPYLLLFFIFVILFFTPLPLFQSGGSDAVVLMQEEAKGATWFFSGALSILSYPIFFLIFLEQNTRRKIFYFLLVLFTSISAGKKTGILEFLINFILIASFYHCIYKYVNLKTIFLIIIGILLSFTFAIFQYTQTIAIDYNSINYSESFNLLLKLSTSSFTSYLEQIHVLGGIKYLQIYSDQLGELGPINYFFNSFIKVFNSSGGIQKGIGPFLNYMIYNSEIPNGVNPTLFYEFMFIGGKKNWAYLSFLIIPFIFYIIFNFLKKLYTRKKKENIYTLSLYFFSIKLLLFFLVDTLNAIRSTPFICILLILNFISRLKIK